MTRYFDCKLVLTTTEELLLQRLVGSILGRNTSTKTDGKSLSVQLGRAFVCFSSFSSSACDSPVEVGAAARPGIPLASDKIDFVFRCRQSVG